MAWTALPTWVVAQVSLASDWNNYVAANLNFLALPPVMRCWKSAADGVASQNPITYDVVQFDNYNGYDAFSGYVYTVPVPGTYLHCAAWSIGTVADGGYINVILYKSGAVHFYCYNTGSGAAGSGGYQAVSYPTCVVGDTLYAAQTNNAAGAPQFESSPYSYMYILKVSN